MTRQQPMDANLVDTVRWKLRTETYRNTYLFYKTKYTMFFYLGNSKEKALKDSVLPTAEKENIFQSSKNFGLSGCIWQ